MRMDVSERALIVTVFALAEAAREKMMATNLKSAWRIAREVIQRQVNVLKNGSIIYITLIFNLEVGSNLCHYSVAKAAVVQLTLSNSCKETNRACSFW